MTRINTNVSSLVAQNILGRSNDALGEALTRLSTGLRINTGKDDPAGLIASENLRSDISSIKRAIGNTDRANQVIATADSALGQVSSLLNDIRGLVTEAANTGALSPAQISANQLQLDSSLEALNRIAQTTTFQGRRLLDGSLDFITTAGDGFSTVTDLKIDQANLGSNGTIPVVVDISAAATRAQITNDGIAEAVAGAQATATLEFTEAATGTVTIDVAAQDASSDSADAGFADVVAGTLTIEATSGTHAAAAGNDLTIVFEEDGGANLDASSSSLDGDVLTITVGTQDAVGGVIDLDALFQAVRDANAGVNDFTSVVDYTDGDITAGDYTVGTDDTANDAATLTFSGGQDAESAEIAIVGVAGASSNITIDFAAEGDTGDAVTVTDNGGGSYTVNLDDDAPLTIAAIASAIQTEIDEISTATTTSTATYNPADDTPPVATFDIEGGLDAGDGDIITVTADAESETPNDLTVSIVEGDLSGGTPTAAFDVDGNIVVTVDDGVASTLTSIATAISGLTGYTASVTSTDGDGSYSATTEVPPADGTFADGVTASGGLDDDIVFEISGASGADVLSFGAGTGIDTIVAAINSGSDSTGIAAASVDDALVLTSSAYGTAAVINVNILSGDENDTFADALSATRQVGTDVAATVNGIQASGKGNTLSINTANLDLTLTVEEGSNTDVNFTIVGGGALFQLGPDVVSNQQARIGITSVNTAKLGGVSGNLFQLGSGGSADLTSNNLNSAARIVEEAIDQITSLRGRLGAFQRTSLETNKNALNDTLVNLTEAESQIRDSDFAAETAALTRAQILVQSGTVVLQISNQNPQNVLSLLR